MCSRIWPQICFSIVCKLRMNFMFFKGYKKREEGEEGYATETTCGWQSLRYLLCGPSQKSMLTSVLRGYVTATTMKEKWIPDRLCGAELSPSSRLIGKHPSGSTCIALMELKGRGTDANRLMTMLVIRIIKFLTARIHSTVVA